MAKKNTKPYFGLGRLISIILAIIPVTSLICGIVTAIQNKSWLWAIVRIFLGWNIFYIIDLLTVVFADKLLLV